MTEGQGRGRLVGGRYRLTAVVGRGGMGTVWRAHDELLDRDVAVKEVLLPPGLESAERDILYQRTFREARASARLSHPGVVTIHDVVREDGRPWIIMEFVRARPLQEIVDQDGPLPPRRVAEIGLQVLEALNHAHAAGILHRDVKPSNVMITAEGRAVLTDFGIAQMPGEVTLTQTGLVMGSPAYIAPERAQGDKAMPASDLWALGATLYTAVEGRSPYERGDAMAALAATLTEDPPPPRRADRLGPIIQGLLVRDPARRMPAAAALPLLADVASGDPVRYPPSTAGPPYGGDWADETHIDRPPFTPAPAFGPPPFDPGSADTVNDPPSLEGAARLEDRPGVGPYGHGPGRYAAVPSSAFEQTWVAHPHGGPSPAEAASHADTVDTADEDSRRAAPERPAGSRRIKNRRLLLGGITFAVGLTLVVGAFVVWPLLRGDSGGGTTASPSPATAPPGYTMVSGPGFSLAAPTGWSRSQDGNNTFWMAPDGSSFIQIDTTAWAGSPNQQALRAESDAKRRADAFGDYSQRRIEDLTYQGQPATDWEFTFTANNRKIHAQDRFVRLGGRSFAIYFRAPDSAWLSSSDRVNVLYQTFRAGG
ncbi:MAG TPA: serine/threonine-protein kinase [Streptosporangiaceae bacterium]|nr:serine/threonine-protein kinase [Streptosporangiaceae bacterium]